MRGCPQVQPRSVDKGTCRHVTTALNLSRGADAIRGDPKTAKQIGLTIPLSLLYRADEAIKWPVAFHWWLRHSIAGLN
jgi:hypothetical protein